MKKETKIKIAAVAGGFTLATAIGSVVLNYIQHPAEWCMVCACAIAMGITIFVGVTIED